jgi:ribonucleoside-diphosphate reductase alpha chain
MRMHRDASYVVPDASCADRPLLDASRAVWEDAVATGELYGYRNAQATVLAPTGTISFLMDCDTTGVEPDFSLVKYKELVGGGLDDDRQPDRAARAAHAGLRARAGRAGRRAHQRAQHDRRRARLADEHLPVFDVAVGSRAISHMGHIQMMGAVQPFISGAISKTVNMPADATVEDIADAYIQAWRCGVKALAIYRDGSKTAQALRTDAQVTKDVETAVEEAIRSANLMTPEQVEAKVEAAVAAASARATEKVLEETGPARSRMPRERQSITHKFSIGGHEGYITAGMYEDGRVGEIFLTDIGKEGSTLRGMMNSFATAISIALQYGVPLETLVQKFAYMRFEPEGITQNPEIPFAKSMPDYIMRWLASRFLDAESQEELGILTPEVRAKKAAEDAVLSVAHSDTAGPAVEASKPAGPASVAATVAPADPAPAAGAAAQGSLPVAGAPLPRALGALRRRPARRRRCSRTCRRSSRRSPGAPRSASTSGRPATSAGA